MASHVWKKQEMGTRAYSTTKGSVRFSAGAGARGFLECCVPAVQWVLRLFTVKNLLDGEDLQPGVGSAIARFVEPGFGCLAEHGFGRRFKAEEDADLSLFAIEHAHKVANQRDRHATCFDGKDDLLRLTGVVVVEVEATIDATVGAFFLLGWACAYLAESPPLELVLVFCGQGGGAFIVGRLPNYFVAFSNLRSKSIRKTLLDKAYGEVGDGAPISTLNSVRTEGTWALVVSQSSVHTQIENARTALCGKGARTVVECGSRALRRMGRCSAAALRVLP